MDNSQTTKLERVVVYLDLADAIALRRVAAAEQRSISAQARRAILEHLYMPQRTIGRP